MFLHILVLLLEQCHRSHASSYDGARDFKSGAVRDAYRHAWKAYSRCAFPKDTLNVINCTGVNDFGGWGITVVDSISTALVMNLTEIANAQIDFTLGIKFADLGRNVGLQTDISAFETTIRIIGGLLSAHDLLQDQKYGQYVYDAEAKAFLLLMQAKQVADTLAPIWSTASGLPASRLDLASSPTLVGRKNSAAAIGTSQLEYARLSDLTNITTYVDQSVAAARLLFDAKLADGVLPTFPGLVGTSFDIGSGKALSSAGGWVGGVDSYYEYLLKLYLYDPSYQDFFQQYKLVLKSTTKHLLSHPAGFPEVTYLAAHNGTQLRYLTQHLTCFAGGNILQSTLLTKNKNHSQIGQDLIAGCRHAYETTATGIAPEVWLWEDDQAIDQPPPPANRTLYSKEHGLYTRDSSAYYYLRPEYMESLFLGWRITHDQKYRIWAWEAFNSIVHYCYNEYGYLPYLDVTIVQPRDKAKLRAAGLDTQESFFLAETLKYAFLILQPDDTLPLTDWVFNTEAHPLKIKAKDTVDQSQYFACFTDSGVGCHLPQIDFSEYPPQLSR